MANTNIQNYVQKQLNNGQEIDGKLIKILVDDFTTISNHKRKLYDRYTVTNIPVMHREMPDSTKVNNRLNNDFVGEIIDNKVSYILGNPIHYSLDKNAYETGEKYKEHQGYMNHFVVRNSMSDLDIELGKLVSICGVAGREIYIDKDGNERIVNLNPWETIFMANTHDEVEYALRYYTELRMYKNELKEVVCVEFFDKDNITYFVKEDGQDEYKLDIEQSINPKQHIFGVTPITKVVNNEEEMGDVERVIELIDAYDRTMSDVNSEIEQFRSAYMFFKGEEPTPEMIEGAKQTGGFYVGQDGEVGFITKNINDTAVENHLNRIEEGIARFAKHVRLNDEKLFGNNSSGDAIKQKMMMLENKTKMLEIKMKSAYFQQFKIITSAWSKKGIDIDYLDIFFGFKRNLPINIQGEADTTIKLKGMVSERTRLERLSFVDDVDYEIEQMEEDNERLGTSLMNDTSTEDRFNLDSVEG